VRGSVVPAEVEPILWLIDLDRYSSGSELPYAWLHEMAALALERSVSYESSDAPLANALGWGCGCGVKSGGIRRGHSGQDAADLAAVDDSGSAWPNAGDGPI
jgi:hypothetical protein